MEKKKVVLATTVITVVIISIILVITGFIYSDRNNYVFKVNGEKIANAEFNIYFNIQKAIMEQEYAAENDGANGADVWGTLIDDVPAVEVARDSAKQTIIETKVKLQEAEKLKIGFTSAEKNAIRNYVLNSAIDLESFNITQDEFIKITEDSMIIEKLATQVFKQTDHSSHSHANIDMEAYESGIVSETMKAEVKSKAEAVLERIKNGEDIATLAGEYSEDPGSMYNGGLYEDTSKGNFVAEYENAALSLNPGELYPELVETSYGYHIIKLESKNDEAGTYTSRHILFKFMENSEIAAIINQELEEKSAEWVNNAEVIVNEQQYSLFK